MPRVYNFKTVGQDKLREGAVYIGRANKTHGLAESKYHNPFLVKSEKDRTWSLMQYEAHVAQKLQDDPHWLDDIKGKDLVCWCHPKPCHGGILIRLANGDDVKPLSTSVSHTFGTRNTPLRLFDPLAPGFVPAPPAQGLIKPILDPATPSLDPATPSLDPATPSLDPANRSMYSPHELSLLDSMHEQETIATNLRAELDVTKTDLAAAIRDLAAAIAERDSVRHDYVNATQDTIAAQFDLASARKDVRDRDDTIYVMQSDLGDLNNDLTAERYTSMSLRADRDDIRTKLDRAYAEISKLNIEISKLSMKSPGVDYDAKIKQLRADFNDALRKSDSGRLAAECRVARLAVDLADEQYKARKMQTRLDALTSSDVVIMPSGTVDPPPARKPSDTETAAQKPFDTRPSRLAPISTSTPPFRMAPMTPFNLSPNPNRFIDEHGNISHTEGDILETLKPKRVIDEYEIDQASGMLRSRTTGEYLKYQNGAHATMPPEAGLKAIGHDTDLLFAPLRKSPHTMEEFIVVDDVKNP